MGALDSRRVFVTGGTGFIGRHLLERLCSAGAEVSCLARHQPEWLTALGVRSIPGDLSSLDALGEGAERADVVFHLAAAKPGRARDEIFEDNVGGTLRLMDACCTRGSARPVVVVASSMAALGPSRVPLAEDAPCRPIGAYGESKAEMERRLEAYRDRLRLIVVRPTAVYGPWDRDVLPLFRLVERGILPLTIGPQRVTLLHVSDLVDGLLASVVIPKAQGLYHLASDRSYGRSEIAEAFRSAAGGHVLTLPVPALALRALGLVGEMSRRWRRGSPIFDGETARQAVASWECDITRAKRDLGFQPRVGLGKGVATTARWYREQGWVRARRGTAEDRS